MPKFSIIIPVYNVKDYLKECFDSVVNQTYSDYEILVIDDGSTDGSSKIIDEYAKKYSKITAYHKKNGGLSDARNYGIKKAKGTYVIFIDSDDFVATDLLKKCDDVISKEKPDLLYFDFYEYSESHKCRSLRGVKDIQATEKERYMMSPPAAWNKVFKRELFVKHDIWFPKGLWYEDLATTPRILMYARRISYLNEPLYYYRQRAGSIMNTVNPKMFQMYDVLEILRKEVHGYSDVLAYLALLNLTFVNRTLSTSREEEVYQKQFQAMAYMEKYYPEWRKNPFFLQEHFWTKWHIRILFSKRWIRLYNWVRKVF